jgi:ribosome biogenesis protein Tsr3
MDTQTVKQIVREELPKLVRSDKRIRKFVLELYREVSLEKADKKETDSRFLSHR